MTESNSAVLKWLTVSLFAYVETVLRRARRPFLMKTVRSKNIKKKHDRRVVLNGENEEVAPGVA
jgi:hypothetical protein